MKWRCFLELYLDIMKLYYRFLRFLKRRLPEKQWSRVGDERVNGFAGLILFFLIFAFVRLMWWGGDNNLAVYTGYDGVYDPEPIFTFINLEGYNNWISTTTAKGVDFFCKYVLFQDTFFRYDTVYLMDGADAVGGVQIFPSCGGNREMVIILFVMLLIPGPSKPRLWYIPSALLAFFAINCFRLALVNLVTKYSMALFPAAHDYSGMAMSVFVFFVWLLWEKKFAEKYRLKAWCEVNAEK